MTKKTLKNLDVAETQLESSPNELSSNAKELSSDFEFIKRLEQCSEIAGSVSALAKLAGLSQSGIRRYFDGGEPTRPVLKALANAVGVSFLWLATGEGPMRKPDGVTEPPSGRAPSSPDPDAYCYIPLYDVYASAGHGAQIDQEQVIDKLAFKQDWLKGEMGLNPDNCCLIHVTGDSMEPTLHKKDVVMLDRSHTIYIEDGVYCLRLDGGLLVKRVQRINGNQVKIISDNAVYQPFIMNTADVEFIGRIVWAGKRF
jgi:phage repressor protein C with HTH and peptisase S24 domain